MNALAGAHSFCALLAPIAGYAAFGVDLDFDAPAIEFDRGEHEA